MAKREARIAIEPLSHTTKSGQRYHRMPEVEAQIASVLHLPPNEIVARARISDSALSCCRFSGHTAKLHVLVPERVARIR